MEVGSFPKRRERVGMSRQSYRDVLGACPMSVESVLGMRFLKGIANSKRVEANKLKEPKTLTRSPGV